jgi:hypothetical protein
MPTEPAAAAMPLPTAPRRRPVLVWLAAAVLLLTALVNGLVAADNLGGVPDPVTGVDEITSWSIGFGSLTALFSVAYIVVAICVFLGVTWARTVGIALAALNVAAVLFSLVSHHGADALLVPIIVLVFLTRYTIAEWCYPQ